MAHSKCMVIELHLHTHSLFESASLIVIYFNYTELRINGD